VEPCGDGFEFLARGTVIPACLVCGQEGLLGPELRCCLVCLNNGWGEPDDVFFIAELIDRQKATGHVLDDRGHLIGFSGGASQIYDIVATPASPKRSTPLPLWVAASACSVPITSTRASA
jgi:hypothetical protein